MNTISRSQKADLLEAIDELFSRENLEQYPMTDTDWQEIFLILLNSYLRSKLSDRKLIFKRLTDQLYRRRHNDWQRSTHILPNSSMPLPSIIESHRTFGKQVNRVRR
jgi:hypothetical protein